MQAEPVYKCLHQQTARQWVESCTSCFGFVLLCSCAGDAKDYTLGRQDTALLGNPVSNTHSYTIEYCAQVRVKAEQRELFLAPLCISRPMCTFH